MIRTKDKILAEPNDPNTIVSSEQLLVNGIIIGDGNKGINYFHNNQSGKVLLVSKKDGTLAALNINEPDKAIGTDSNGEIVLYDRSDLI